MVAKRAATDFVRIFASRFVVLPEIIVYQAGSGGTADPLNQFNTIAWKSAFTAIILQQLAIIHYETAVTG